MSHYTMLSKYGDFKQLLKIKNKLKIRWFLEIKSGRILDIFLAFLIKQLFPIHSRLLDMRWLQPTHIQRALVA